eukprot:TRINITY_DN13230_c0_g1_i2.p1 TRINITY_DN13230_c0_g1~~TRINITY_DN13230_c0_g1_i2.p1  ORF type:complete len:383 (+),score=105.85 TRINITY_DN13230_c0_g1_i2:58-1206(+)
MQDGFRWACCDTRNGGALAGPVFMQTVDTFGHAYSSAIGDKAHVRPEVVRWRLRRCHGSTCRGSVRIGVCSYSTGPAAIGGGFDWERAKIPAPRLGVTRRLHELFSPAVTKETESPYTGPRPLPPLRGMGPSGMMSPRHGRGLSALPSPRSAAFSRDLLSGIEQEQLRPPEALLQSACRDDCRRHVWYVHGTSDGDVELRTGCDRLEPIHRYTEGRVLPSLAAVGTTVTVTLDRVLERLTWSVQGVVGGSASCSVAEAGRSSGLSLYLSLRSGAGAWEVVEYSELTPAVAASLVAAAACISAFSACGMLSDEWWQRRADWLHAVAATRAAAGVGAVALLKQRLSDRQTALGAAAPAAIAAVCTGHGYVASQKKRGPRAKYMR